MVAKKVALKRKDLLWKLCCTHSWHLMFKAVCISRVVCMCSAVILESSGILCVGCVMEHTRAHMHTRVQSCRLCFKEVEKIILLCINFCLAFPSWRTDGELAILKTVARSISSQGKIICHLWAYSLRVTFTLLVNCVLVMNFQVSLNTCGKSFDTLITNSIWTAV